MLIEYGIIKIIWLAFIAILLVGFTITGGADLGIAMLLPFIGKTDDECRVILNTIAPTWEGNQVWLILAGGAIFAAFPFLYATAFSGLYWAFLLALFGLILRPPGLDFRSKLNNKCWRQFWDVSIFLSGLLPALVFGLAFGNTFIGFPFYFDSFLHSFYTGSFFSLLNPIAIVFGICNISLLLMHSSIFLKLKTDNILAKRAQLLINYSGSTLILSFLACIFLVINFTDGFSITSIKNINDALVPSTSKTVVMTGNWLTNFNEYKALYLLPLIAIINIFKAIILTNKDKNGYAFIASSVAITFTLLTIVAALFPFLMPSSLNPSHSLTIWDACSSNLTLNIMFWVTVLFLPIIIFYTSWAYSVVRGKINKETISKNANSY